MRLLDELSGLIIANNVAVAIGLYVFDFMEIEVGFVVLYFFVLAVVVVFENRLRKRAWIAESLLRLKG